MIVAVNRLREQRTVTAALLLIALILRGGSLWFGGASLLQDRDGYLGIAQNLIDGNGYAEAELNRPTAYRPPLYPVLLAGLGRVADWKISIAAMHLAAGVGTVFLTLWIGRRLGLGRFSDLAAGLVAVDPLLVQYAAYPMTETVFTLLVTGLIAAGMLANWGVTIDTDPKSVVGTEGDGKTAAKSLLDPNVGTGFRSQRLWREALVGVVFGLCALCRPSIWPFACLSCVLWVCRAGKRAGSASRPIKTFPRYPIPWLMALVAALTICVWPIRNIAVFGWPIVTTTHGGYTYLLGNNPVFDDEVVSQPWGTVWSGTSLSAWQRDLESQMDRVLPPGAGELERDRWMYDRAEKNINLFEVQFWQACWLRVRRFWNIAPQGPTAKAMPHWAWWMVAGFYSLVFVGMLAGIVRLTKFEWFHWLPLILLIVSFTIVHTLYWSNMRMRAPLIPVIALFAARGVIGKRPSVFRSAE